MSSEDESLQPAVDAEYDFERPTTGDNVASVEESTVTTASTDSLPTPTPILFPVQATTHDRGTLVFGVTQNPLARPSAMESGSQGFSETSDSTRRAPGGQSAISLDLPQTLSMHVALREWLHDILRPFDLSPSLLSKDVSEPTVEEATPSGCDNREKREVEDEDGSEEVRTSSPSPPTYIPAETTGHMHLPHAIDKSAGSHHPSEYPPLCTQEKVDAKYAVQIIFNQLKPRDLKCLEGRYYIVLRVDVQVGYFVIVDATTGKRTVLKESQSEDYPRLCTLLLKLNHKKVTGFLEAVKDEVFLKYTSYGTVREQFRDNECFQLRPDLISYILKQVLQAVSYLHQKGIRHGDITGDNVVVCSSNWLCKLINFDHSVKDVSKERTNKGTWCYSSPDLIADPKCSYSSDVRSAMLLLVVMTTGPWHSSIERDDISGYSEQRNYPELVDESLYRQRLWAKFGNTPEYAHQLAIFNELAALARKVLVRDPSQRPSADDLLNSPVMIRASTWKTVARPPFM